MARRLAAPDVPTASVTRRGGLACPAACLAGRLSGRKHPTAGLTTGLRRFPGHDHADAVHRRPRGQSGPCPPWRRVPVAQRRAPLRRRLTFRQGPHLRGVVPPLGAVSEGRLGPCMNVLVWHNEFGAVQPYLRQSTYTRFPLSKEHEARLPLEPVFARVRNTTSSQPVCPLSREGRSACCPVLFSRLELRRPWLGVGGCRLGSVRVG